MCEASRCGMTSAVFKAGKVRSKRRRETEMPHALPPLHDGHAPITLQQLFRDALYAFEEWDKEPSEPLVTFEERVIPISVAFEALRDCTDIVPRNIVGSVTDRLTKPWAGEGPLDEMQFSTAARVMAVLVRKHHLAIGSLSPAPTIAAAETAAPRS